MSRVLYKKWTLVQSIWDLGWKRMNEQESMDKWKNVHGLIWLSAVYRKLEGEVYGK